MGTKRRVVVCATMCIPGLFVGASAALADLAACRANLQACLAAQNGVVRQCVLDAAGGISEQQARAAVDQCLANQSQARNCVRVADSRLENNPTAQIALQQCAQQANISAQGCNSAFTNCRAMLPQP